MTAAATAERQPPPPVVEHAGVRAVPSLHGRLRFAALVRRAFHERRPQAIAVELPATLEGSIRKAVERLPYLSVVAYEDYDAELEKETQILPVVPDDSLIEAVRLGLEHDVPVHFIDRDVLGHRSEPLRVPDDYLVDRLGLETYLQHVQPTLPRAEPGSVDADREVEMAARLRELRAHHDDVLFVCGLAHWAPVRDALTGGAEPPAGAVTQREQTLYNLAAESVPAVLADLPYHAYAYELARFGLHPADYPQLMPLPNVRGGERDAAEEAYAEALEHLVAALRGRSSGPAQVDTYELLTELVQGAVKLYAREWNEQPAPARLNNLLRFARNLALVHRRLTPSRYEVVLAAKNTVNDDFAFQVLRQGDHYPFYEADSELPEMKVEGEGQGEADGEPIVLRLRLPRAMQQGLDDGDLEDLELPEEAEEYQDGSWQERWEDGEHQVSHLPQDGRLEAFFQYIREKCRRLLSDQQVRIREMQASLLDGLDLRETLRNLPLGKIFVRENLPGVADVGPVVVIFHKPGEEHHYPHEKMWFAEHGDESDLALYSTEPGVRLDGPGISRCQYGGVLSLYPPSGRARVWGNPRYGGSRNRSEVLLKAAVDLTRKPIVAYVAPQGPPADIQHLAAARGVQILFIPLDNLSADLIKRVRTFHVLADRYIRPLAGRYIN